MLLFLCTKMLPMQAFNTVWVIVGVRRERRLMVCKSYIIYVDEHLDSRERIESKRPVIET